jgi:putative nucleotidyltransferase with HDIG domain
MANNPTLLIHTTKNTDMSSKPLAQTPAQTTSNTTASPHPPQEKCMNVDKFIGDLLDDLKSNQLELPVLPQVAVKVSKIIDDPGARAMDLAKAIGADPALSARVIQVANSPLVRGSHKIDNLQSALTRMGNTMVRNIVTTFMVRQLFRTDSQYLQNRMKNIWNHSAHVAAISHVLATHFSILKPDEAMLAGVLHDIGKLPILSKARKIPHIEENEKPLNMVLARLHPALGKAILSAWRFDDEFIDAAAEHENIYRDSKVLDFADIVLVANIHSHMGKPDAKRIEMDKIPALKKLNLDPEASIAVLEEAHNEIVEIQKLLTN